eukprot:6214745-Pleurochrysis_carterae.AAC.2
MAYVPFAGTADCGHAGAGWRVRGCACGCAGFSSGIDTRVCLDVFYTKGLRGGAACMRHACVLQC